ncbi:MAG: hypothetical protein HS111_11135 [Kofleriaceae bacterium]|nr:hypothetical protein [Kofleriaceae bacterium]MCL4223357.1 hypothetical protein [Myxococcales bacterium]
MKRVVAAALALALLLLLAWWWRRDRPTPPAREVARPAPALPAARGEVSAPPADDELPPPRRLELPPAQPPIIDEITVEKREVCEGEDSLVTVRAHTPGNSDDAHLHYVIAGETGPRVPVVGRRREADDGHEPPPLTITVFGRDNVATTVPLPEIRVKPCKVPRRVHIHTRLLPNAPDELELYAQVMDVGAMARMKPVAARWWFGDGTSAETTTPLTSHSYAGRPQTSLFSTFLVEVEITGADGERVRGRTSVQLMNLSFEHRHYRGLVLLRTELFPRFPELGPDGKVVQRVHVWHDHDQPVHLTRILRRQHLSGGAVAEAERLAPGVLLPGATLGVGARLDAAVELDAAGQPDLAMIEYVIEGRSADGLPAQGGFAVMRPPPRPTRDNSDPVLDPALVARIKRAREVLRKEYVTDEDLWRLEKEGAFADLPPTAPPTGEGTPGDRPMPPPPPPVPPPPRPGTPPPPPKPLPTSP